MELVGEHINSSVNSAESSFLDESGAAKCEPLNDFCAAYTRVRKLVRPFVDEQGEGSSHAALLAEFYDSDLDPLGPVETFRLFTSEAQTHWTCEGMDGAVDFHEHRLKPLAARSHALIGCVDLAFKVLSRTIDLCEKELAAKDHALWDSREINKARKAADAARHGVVERLKQVRYFQRQAAWLIDRFANAQIADVPGLCKVVTRADIEAADWSLTPGRFVGVAPAEIDADFDFEQTLRDIHLELADLNREAVDLAAKIQTNFEELGV